MGGMGEVYRATDTNLKRQVAIKVLPEEVAGDADRLARFRREAEVLASLNHPNIAAIHGLEKSDGRTALVMELVEGSTLADRIERGQVPVDEALSIARQIAEALEAAHEQGIIHRDLKPANVKVRPDGTVKVLDFGLAKAMEPVAALRASTEQPATASPTITTAAMTQAGVILGTAAYMSPEQASGRAVDRRTDIWAFGCVLYEMLTGRRAFGGATSLEVMAAVLERDVDWTALPPATPARVRVALRRTLEKDPRRRLHDIADARIEFDDRTTYQPEVPAQAGAMTSARWLAALVVTAIVVGVVAGSLAWYVKPTSGDAFGARGATRFELVTEAPVRADPSVALAASPDGRRIAYVATSGDNRRSLYLRDLDLDQFEAHEISDTDGATGPAFSPDGNFIAFEADGQIKKVAVAGGAVLPLCTCSGAEGPSWESNDSILFARQTSGIWRVSARAGEPSQVTMLRPGEFAHTFPQILPGGKALLYSSSPNGMMTPRIFVESLLDSGERREVGQGAGARYLPSGHLVYTQSGRLLAVPFDRERFEPTGEPTVVRQGIQEAPFGAPQITYSDGGSIAYLPATGGNQQTLVWVDGTGREDPVAVLRHNSSMPRIAPDGRRVLVMSEGDVWLYDLTRRGDGNRLTFDGENSYPVWDPAGAGFAYRSESTDPPELRIKPLDGTPERPVPTEQGADIPLSWSRDGFLAAVAVTSDTANDIWVHRLDADGGATLFKGSRFREGAPTFSSDGRMIAFVSDQSDRLDVYMRAFPGPGQDLPVSIGGGNEPVFARQAGRLFFRQGDAMMVADISTEAAADLGEPRVFFEGQYDQSNASWPNYDVAPDGERLLMIKRDAPEASTRINVVLDWVEELRRLVPAE